MGLVDEFAAWLRRWFSEEEVEAMVVKSWTIDEGARLRGNVIMNLEELMHLAASFIAEKVLGCRFIKIVAKCSEVFILDVDTRTVMAAAQYPHLLVDPGLLEAFLEDMLKQAEEAKDFYMSVRSLVC